jgi:hypothetical protein
LGELTVEALANLANNNSTKSVKKQPEQNGVKHCRTCYDHLAGFVGVKIVETLETKGYLTKSKNIYLVTEKGWEWFQFFNISKDTFTNNRRPVTLQCLDWSERRPHLAGQLGATFLNKMLERKWFKRVEFSRELVITGKGCQEIYELLGVAL